MRKGNKLCMAVLALAMFFMAAVPAWAYFTSYVSSSGSYEIDISCKPDLIENLDDWGQHLKHVSVKSLAGDIYVRVKAIGPSAGKISYNCPDESAGWQAGKDGWWYWKDPISKDGESGKLDIQASTAADLSGFAADKNGLVPWDVFVVCEAVPAVYDADGEPYADWNLQFAMPGGTVEYGSYTVTHKFVDGDEQAGSVTETVYVPVGTEVTSQKVEYKPGILGDKRGWEASSIEGDTIRVTKEGFGTFTVTYVPTTGGGAVQGGGGEE